MDTWLAAAIHRAGKMSLPFPEGRLLAEDTHSGQRGVLDVFRVGSPGRGDVGGRVRRGCSRGQFIKVVFS